MEERTQTEHRTGILYIDKSNVFAGAELCLNELVLAIDGKAYACSILFNFPREVQERYSDRIMRVYRNSKLQFWMGSEFSARAPRGSDLIKRIFFAFQLARIIKKKKISIVHINLLRNTDFLDIRVAKFLGCKVVGHLRSLQSQNKLTLRVINNCDRIVCTSEFVCNEIKGLKSVNTQIVRIYDPVNIENYRLNNQNQFSSKYKKCKFLISSVGLLDPRKGHELAIRAFDIVRKSYPEVSLLIAGDDRGSLRNERERLEKLVFELGLVDAVVIAGAIDNMAEVYASSDIVLALSKDGEAFGRVAIEASGAGCIFIGTNLGATPELILNGVNGFLVEPNDVLGTARIMIDVLNNKSRNEAIVNQGIVKALEFSPAKHAEGISKVYSSLMLQK